MKLKLKILKEKDVKQSYVDWYKDDKVIHYSNNQYRSFTLEGQRKYVNSCINSKDINLYGIFESDLHIGNILISGLSSLHKRAEITYVIGNSEYWGKGIGTFAVSEITTKAKKIYKLNKLCAGVAEGNIASQKVLEKNGFVLEGKRLKHLFFGGIFYNQLDYGLLL